MIPMDEAVSKALGERRGIRRYGSAVIPMDEACARVSLERATGPT